MLSFDVKKCSDVPVPQSTDYPSDWNCFIRWLFGLRQTH